MISKNTSSRNKKLRAYWKQILTKIISAKGVIILIKF